ncbi:MAG: SIR2 family protein, partial [Planctomycetota bacterium]|nr:SIR2 family protein [Planctomycetota bacterium]
MNSTEPFSDALEAALNGEAVLFTGAGFSFGAINVKGESPKSSPELAAELAAECGIDEETFLDEAAGFFLEDHGTDELISRLRPQYSISSVAEHHTTLARIPWLRVYTTNYDNVYETACSQLPRAVQPLTLQYQPQDVSFTRNDCIHLNGVIDQLNRQTIQSSFKLTRVSY